MYWSKLNGDAIEFPQFERMREALKRHGDEELAKPQQRESLANGTLMASLDPTEASTTTLNTAAGEPSLAANRPQRRRSVKKPLTSDDSEDEPRRRPAPRKKPKVFIHQHRQAPPSHSSSSSSTVVLPDQMNGGLEDVFEKFREEERRQELLLDLERRQYEHEEQMMQVQFEQRIAALKQHVELAERRGKFALQCFEKGMDMEAIERVFKLVFDKE